MTGQELWQQARQHGLAAAFWRLPGAAQAAGVVCYNPPKPTNGEPSALDEAEPGFLFFPFDNIGNRQDAPSYFLPADVYFDGQQSLSRDENDTEWVPVGPHLNAALALAGEFPADLSQNPPLPFCADEVFFRQLVTDGVAAIRSGELSKVVASRASLLPLPADFDAWAAFEQLQTLYPLAFVSLVQVPGQGIWLGATPEVLAELTPTEIRTVALAGTQPETAAATTATATWGDKETEEQNVVADYIAETLAGWQLDDIHQAAPRTIAAGPLLHRRTEFSATLRRTNGQPLKASWLVFDLHPTPAVGGSPSMEAVEFIQQHEGYHRRYYSGFLGPVNLPTAGTSHLFVNLRCAELRPKAGVAVLYAGAGLTADSDPAREWQETEMKMRVIGAVLTMKNEQ